MKAISNYGILIRLGLILNHSLNSASADWSRERFTMDESLCNSVTEAFVQLVRTIFYSSLLPYSSFINNDLMLICVICKSA